MVKKINLGDKFAKEIKSLNFNDLEWKGFKENPTNALLIGIAVGYKMGQKDLDKYIISDSSSLTFSFLVEE